MDLCISYFEVCCRRNGKPDRFSVTQVVGNQININKCKLHTVEEIIDLEVYNNDYSEI
jgi:hypothetical protein